MDKFGSVKYEESINEEGNENSSSALSKKGKRQILSKYWCSGIFNHSVDEISKMMLKHKHFEKGILGEELCPKTGNKHLQCFFAFSKAIRPIEAFKAIKTKWIKCNGDECQNERYCRKEGTFHKIGEYFKSDWKITFEDLREEQKQMVTEILVPVCPKFNRQVLWYYEVNGEYGKTITYTYLCDNHKCLIVGGKEADMKFALVNYIKENGNPKIIIVNLEKSKSCISYTGLEALLDGIFFSSKYESGMVRFPRCRVAVFANIAPRLDKMGKNRFVVKNLTPNIKGVLEMLTRS
jgi:hypothetical protein